LRFKKTRCSPSAISPRASTTPCEGAHKARGGHCPDAVVIKVCHHYHPGGVCSHSSRVKKRSCSPLAIGKGRAATPRQRAHIPVAGGLRGQPAHGAGSGGVAGSACACADICVCSYGTRGGSKGAGGGALGAKGSRGAGCAGCSGVSARSGGVGARGAGGAGGAQRSA
jgi:hypothetical protein